MSIEISIAYKVFKVDISDEPELISFIAEDSRRDFTLTRALLKGTRAFAREYDGLSPYKLKASSSVIDKDFCESVANVIREFKEEHKIK